MSSHHTQKSQNSQSPLDIFPIYKEAGETLHELIIRFRNEQSFPDDLPVTYAGRLDPMAEGLMILLVGESCKEKDSYLGLDKTYIFEVLFGVATDTFDMLGLVTEIKEYMPNEQKITQCIGEIKRTKTFFYPPFSSKPVDGKPLFAHAKAGTLPEELPTIQGQIKSLNLKEIKEFSFKEVVKEKLEAIATINGDFRQKEIRETWQQFLEKNKDKRCVVATFEATVSSGVYIRTIATMFGGPALAYSIKRIRVGDFEI